MNFARVHSDAIHSEENGAHRRDYSLGRCHEKHHVHLIQQTRFLVSLHWQSSSPYSFGEIVRTWRVSLWETSEWLRAAANLDLCHGKSPEKQLTNGPHK